MGWWVSSNDIFYCFKCFKCFKELSFIALNHAIIVYQGLNCKAITQLFLENFSKNHNRKVIYSLAVGKLLSSEIIQM